MESSFRVTDGPYIRVKSESSTSEYKVFAIGTPEQYCTCPAWKNQSKTYTARKAERMLLPGDRRFCKHIDKLIKAGVSV